MKTYFLMVARGIYKAFDNSGQITCKYLFESEDDARSYEDKFKEVCCGDGLTDLDPKTIKISLHLSNI